MSGTAHDADQPRLLAESRVAAIRAELPSTASIAYLNAGTLGPMPRAATEAMAAELERQSDFRQSPGVWELVSRAQVRAREVSAQILDVRPDQIALMHATHEGINTALWALDFAPGTSIVTTDQEHPGVTIPLDIQRERRGCTIRTAVWKPGECPSAAIAALVDDTTIAVVLSHVSWRTGAIANLAALRAAVGSNVRIIVDGAQGAGIVPVSQPRDGWDAYTISGQKWPLGPHGTGALALREPEEWLPVCCSMSAIMDPSGPASTTCKSCAARFEQAQEAALPLIGYGISARWVVDEIGIADAHAHARALARYLHEGIADVTSLHPTGNAHLVCIDVPAGSSERIVAALAERGVQIRSLTPDRIRVSLGPWNTVDEVDELLSVLTQPGAHRQA